MNTKKIYIYIYHVKVGKVALLQGKVAGAYIYMYMGPPATSLRYRATLPTFIYVYIFR